MTNPSVQEREKKKRPTGSNKKLRSASKLRVVCASGPSDGEFPSAHPVVLQKGGVSVLAARLLHKQFLTGGLVLVQHALPRVDHPVGGERK